MPSSPPPAPALVETAENPAPSGAHCAFVAGDDGVRLRAARWPALAGTTPRGTVCLLHGRTEFLEKYFETVADLRRRGFAVASLDWRGQGGSQRARVRGQAGHVDSFDEYVRDLDVFLRDFVLPECPAPYYALAHSMAGAVLLLANRRRPARFERIVLSAPMLRIRLGGMPAGLLRALSEMAVFAGLGDQPVGLISRKAREDTRFEGNLLTSDPVRFARMRATLAAGPHLRTGAPTLAWLNAAGAAMAEIEREDFPAGLVAPVLLIAAGGDRVVSTPAIERFAGRLRAGGHVLVPGACHELLMEADTYREPFLAAFDAFVPGETPAYAGSFALG